MTHVIEATPSPRPSLVYVVKQLEQATRARLDLALRGSGVTALQYTALAALDQRPSMTTSDLARASFVRVQSVADLVTALKRRGLIEPRLDPDDRRRMILSLTDEGRDFLAEYDERVLNIEEQMLRDLDDCQRDALRSALNACRHALVS